MKTLKIIVLKGLPASGKSTWAKQMVTDNPGKYKRINKDDLRLLLDSSIWSKQNEKFILLARDILVNAALTKGYNVIIDDTNLSDKHFKRMQEIAEEFDIELEEKFFDVPLMECIERDAKRGAKSVGAKVILGMYNQFLKPKEPEECVGPTAILCDIDGTVAIMNGRSPYDWSKVGTDLPNQRVIEIVQHISPVNELIMISGRDESCREETIKWLEKHEICFDKIYMRPAGDFRKDFEIKKEIYENHIRGKYNVIAVFDDRNQVVDLWRSLGLTCLQVDYGNF